jgi:hypothetical protein
MALRRCVGARAAAARVCGTRDRIDTLRMHVSGTSRTRDAMWTTMVAMNAQHAQQSVQQQQQMLQSIPIAQAVQSCERPPPTVLITSAPVPPSVGGVGTPSAVAAASIPLVPSTNVASHTLPSVAPQQMHLHTRTPSQTASIGTFATSHTGGTRAAQQSVGSTIYATDRLASFPSSTQQSSHAVGTFVQPTSPAGAFSAGRCSRRTARFVAPAVGHAVRAPQRAGRAAAGARVALHRAHAADCPFRVANATECVPLVPSAARSIVPDAVVPHVRPHVVPASGAQQQCSTAPSAEYVHHTAAAAHNPCQTH